MLLARSTSPPSKLQKSGESTNTICSHSSIARSRALTQLSPPADRLDIEEARHAITRQTSVQLADEVLVLAAVTQEDAVAGVRQRVNATAGSQRSLRVVDHFGYPSSPKPGRRHLFNRF